VAQSWAILLAACRRDTADMSRPVLKPVLRASEQLEKLLGDDWPEQIPVTEAEVEVFEAWFGDLFDELFGPCR
jgi:hypothetical protein